MGIEIRSRSYLSIELIGRYWFWTGTALGFFFSLTVLNFTVFSFEAIRTIGAFSSDLIPLSNSEIQFISYFLSAFSTALVILVCLIIWCQGLSFRSIKKTKVRLIQTMISFTFWVTIMGFYRLSTIIEIMPYSMRGYGDELLLLDNYWLLFVLFPIHVFLFGWAAMKLAFRVGNWLYLSSIAFVGLTLLLPLGIGDVFQVSEAYSENLNAKEYGFVYDEISRYKSLYEVDFEKKQVDNLKYQSTPDSEKQLLELKSAIERNSQVSLDTILMERISFGLSKSYSRLRGAGIDGWEYAEPKHLVRQLGYFEAEDDETLELVLLLSDMIKLFNARSDYHDLSWPQRYLLRYKYSRPLVDQLRGARELVVSNEKYLDYYYLLPAIE